jgi:hypothetical protein
MRKIHFFLCIIFVVSAGMLHAQGVTKDDAPNTNNKGPFWEAQSIGPSQGPFKVKVDGGVGPSLNNTYDLGSNTMRWRDIFIGPHSIHIGNGPNDQANLSHSNSNGLSRLTIDADDNGTFDFYLAGNGDFMFTGALMPDSNSGNSGDILRSNGTSSPAWVDIQTLAWSKTGNSNTDTTINFVGTTDNNDLVFRTNNISRARFRNSTGDGDSGAFEPYMGNAYTLGTPTHRWRDGYFGPASLHIGGFISGSHGGGQDPQTLDEATISYSNGSLMINKAIQSSGSLVPNDNDLFTLGSNTNRWADLYLNGSSLHIGSSTVEGTISFDTTNQLLQFNTDGAGAAEIIMSGSGGAGKLGIAATPSTSLDVNGDVSFRFSNLTLANGVNTGVNVGSSSAARITGPTAAFELHGITGGQNGKVLELYNTSGQTMRIQNESGAESTASNRITTGTGASYEVRNMGSARLIYNSTDSRWVLADATRNTSGQAWSIKTYSSFGGTNQTAWAPDFGYVCHRISSSSNVTISGINSTGAQDGTMIVIFNVGTSSITLQNDNGGAASASYRILTGTGNNEALSPNEPATLVYDATSQRWRMIAGR